MTTPLITPDLVRLDLPLGADREQTIRALASLVVDAGRATEVDSLFADAWAREQKTDTGVPGGIAIPHCRSTSVLEPTLAMARLNPKVDFGAADGPADLAFFIAAPDGADQMHLQLLAKLARSLIREDFTAALRAATTPQQIVDLVDGALEEEPAPAASTATAPGTTRLVAVTACATGIAHTYMAADALAAAAQRAGVDLTVETQGSAGMTPIPAATIAAADAVIFAVDVDVREKGRFAGKPVVQGPVKIGIDNPDKVIADAVAASTDPNAPRVAAAAGASGAGAGAASGSRNPSVGGVVKRSLLTGVSYMIPFVAGGGLLIALGFLIGGYEVALGDSPFNADKVLAGSTLVDLNGIPLNVYLGAIAFKIGALSFGFLVPALAGFIAYGIADRPGIAPGFAAGAVALYMGAGFLGGIVGGLLAGLAAWWLGRFRVARWLRGLMPVVIIPLLASIFASGLMFLLLGGPIAALTKALSGFLAGLSGTGVIVLGIILGLMMCFDLGGPVNKVAYGFATANLAAGINGDTRYLQIMAAVMAAGMVPPLAMALASTVLGRGLFSEAERENGKAAWLLGASFISEGAIPFAAADVFRVIPASMVGGAITGALSMAFGVTSKAPHGGVFVFFAIDSFPLWALSIVIGAAVSAFLVIALKRFVRRRPVTLPEEQAIAQPVVPAVA
ncbi:MAG: PTS sugar transporter subunit IIA [Micrococcales bacterium]|nr:PTS sugar transporter subunit IIA [Micrococcales bacterium]